MYYDMQQYDKAVDAYKDLYKAEPANHKVYDGYIKSLMAAEEYKQAEKLLEKLIDQNPNNPVTRIDLGTVLKAQGKDKQAENAFEDAISKVNGDDMLTQLIAQKFISMERDDLALQTYEHATKMLHNNYLYSGPMSQLYFKMGNLDRAISTLLDASRSFYNRGVEEVKATLLEYLGDDKKKLAKAQKALIKKINEEPENPYYSDLLIWIYTQKNDWEGAFIQVRALDERYDENGERIVEFARYAVKEKEYQEALKAYDEALQMGDDYPFKASIINEQLDIKFLLLQENPEYAQEEVIALGKEYQTFLDSFPQYYVSETLRDYAKLEAQYADNPQKAIDLLQKSIAQPNARIDFAARCKLQLGDYYILVDRVWDASLTYSQVDKDFREDMLGEEARFRNGKLAYYRGDFDWANGQLSVLKASTSELIANDALYLSVLITENIPPDSNYLPLERFAHADLLLFQNKDEQAEKILDSIATYFPEHPLQDDILMQQAAIAKKHRKYEEAISYLKEIHTKHAKDVLADDALYKIAQIYEQNLENNKEAGEYYSQLVIEYPGSTFVQLARKKIKELEPTVPL